MRILLDTVALYRAAIAPEGLPDSARALLEDESQELFVSLASAWELAIKVSLGKLTLPRPVEEFFSVAARDLLAREIGIDLAAIGRVATLPHHHRNPFDRLIIAQALLNDCSVMTSDGRMAAYGVSVLW